MKLSELFGELQGIEDLVDFTAYLAAPDEDGTDVDLVSVGRVEVDYENHVARIYPASTDTDPDSVEPEPYLEMILSQFPKDAFGESDLELLVEVPLLRDEPDHDKTSLVGLAGVHVGKASEEVWLLVRPAEEFAEGLLPD